jgi:diguanylate cyclase (GGDEF)-like protein
MKVTVTSAWRGPRPAAVAVRDWPVWSLPRLARAYVIAVPVAAAIALGVAADRATWHVSQLGIFFLLLASAAAMVEAAKDVKLPPDTLTRDLQEVWWLSVALLLPPVYALLMPVPLVLMKQWRVRRNLWHRRLFSMGAIGLGYGAASVEFHSVFEPLLGVPPGAGAHSAGWLGAIIAAAVTGWAVNVWLVVGAVKLTVPAARVRAMMFSREAVTTDAVETCFAALVAFALSCTPAVLIVAVPVVLVQKRFLMHSQLVAEARTDAKTGLLNAAAWHRESATELSRAKGSWSPASAAIIDIDHFKLVNDTHGHLAGDRVLRVVADRFKAQLREGDLIGRFGGEEFAILLPRTTGLEAERVAERLRGHIADAPIAVSGGRDEPILVRITVSIGVAELASARQDLDELLAAADAALYQAKDAGRNRIRVVTAELAGAQVPAPRGPGPAAAAPQ